MVESGTTFSDLRELHLEHEKSIKHQKQEKSIQRNAANSTVNKFNFSTIPETYKISTCKNFEEIPKIMVYNTEDRLDYLLAEWSPICAQIAFSKENNIYLQKHFSSFFLQVREG